MGGATRPRRSTRREEKEKEKEKEKQPTPLPESPSNDEADEEEDPAEQSDASEEPVVEQPTRRRGRPPRKATIVEPPPIDDFDEAETPGPGSPTAPDSPSSMPQRRRGRGRPSSSGLGGRSRGARGGPSHTTSVPSDKFGNEQQVKNNEIDLPEDPAGELKVDKDGNLLGGRQYRCRTFTMMNCGDQLYMLSTEPARCAGFRDSYLFFQRHKQLYKIICNDEEKFDLIKRNIIPHSYKGRAIGVCTARSVFREFGARMIVGGKKVTDDYYEQAARMRGDKEGEIADPDDRLPPPGVPYNQNQYVAWHGASAVYHQSAPAIIENKTSSAGGLLTVNNKKKKLTEDNWMAEVAQNTAEYNKLITEHRLARTLTGLYEPHTNQKHFPGTLQPTAAKFEKISDSMLPPDQFLDPSVPAEKRKYPRGASATIEQLTVAPPVSMPLSAREYAQGRGIMFVDPSIYADQLPEIKNAIIAQVEAEKAHLAQIGIKPLPSN
ncbi:uncharacterized protein DFL_008282 [Arthrobotrys flagrans]|uniref:Uncharacterized protein n=1 Tax=Arthrobotrys flagrans TaxID=97331 RepID=A0A436ZNE0_ARTFL|nr:hypothetical protein DFL_008282 [Arthrobotrys flagrans]